MSSAPCRQRSLVVCTSASGSPCSASPHRAGNRRKGVRIATQRDRVAHRILRDLWTQCTVDALGARLEGVVYGSDASNRTERQVHMDGWGLAHAAAFPDRRPTRLDLDRFNANLMLDPPGLLDPERVEHRALESRIGTIPRGREMQYG